MPSEGGHENSEIVLLRSSGCDLALTLQGPLPDDELVIAAKGERKDEAA